MMKEFMYKSSAILGLVLLLLTGCTPDDSDISHLTDIQTPYITLTSLIEEERFLGEGMSGFGAWVSDPNWFDPEHEYYRFAIDWEDVDNNHPFLNNHVQIVDTDVPFLYVVENHTSQKQEFMVSFLLNYETIPFRLLGETDYQSSLTFSLESAYELRVPIALDSDFLEQNTTYNLTAVTFMGPHSEFPMRSVVSSDLTIGAENDIHLSMPYNTIPHQRVDVPFHQGFLDLQINQQFDDDLADLDFFDPPPAIIEARPGEFIDLAFFADPSMQTFTDDDLLENYLIFAFLGEEQAVFNESDPYLFVDASNHEYTRIVDHGTFTIKAPKEPGFYDFIAFIAPNPMARRSFFNGQPLDSSHHFIIEVVE